MDGIHDVGGMHGFGPIDRDDPALEPWEALRDVDAVVAVRRELARRGVDYDELDARYKGWIVARRGGS